MKLSVVTCTWNSMATVRQTVESVRMQRDVSVEQVFVDGGSTDGTLEYLEGLPGETRILRDVRGGISRAMNAGAAAVSGDALCHLHADDYFLHPQVLTRVRLAFERTRAAWLFGRIINDFDGGLFAETYRVPAYTRQRLLRGNFIPHPAVFVTTAAFAAVGGFREDLKYAMDYDFLLRLARRYEPAPLAEVLTVFRRHAGSTSHRNRRAAFEEDHRVRMAHVSGGPMAKLPHALRHAVRKRRLDRELNHPA